ncbi:MarR family transcriptional regulator [Leeia sp. TBRC 13508]|uniref:MarR family transcriptional regulator n=1 Tax=Leeia speluncae TaxID=2884804 RepID=A0ABS8D1F9_9NEIS|nr:MarR family transcriptional regulator [Leeia speluncae]MCB6182033.1 MarR family transcriptional regulator [Leeia speluncae]
MSYSLERNLLQQLGRTSRAMYSAFESEVGEALPKMRILLQVEKHAPVGQKQLAQVIGIDPASLTRQMKQLELDGLVKRESDLKDNRHTIVTLTAKGEKRLAELRPKRQTFLNDALAGFSEEQLSMVEQVLSRLEQRFQSVEGTDQP